MSVRIMTAAWAVDLPAGDKLVLLALADCANDEGRCWPGIRSLCAKTGKSERSLQGAIQSLCAGGHLTRDEVPGKGCNYTVHPRATTPAEIAPRRNCPPQKTAETPAEFAGKPSRTVIVEERVERERAILRSPQWKAFKAMRRDIKRPINPTSEARLLTKLLALEDDGYPPGDVLDQSTENCWRGVFKIEERDDGRSQAGRGSSQRMGRHQSPDGLSPTTRAALKVFGTADARH